MTLTIPPPSLRLPPIARIAAFTTSQLSESVQYLHSFYRPQVRGSRRRREALGDHDGDDDNHDDRFDAFERAYAIRWLTALIVQLEAQTPCSPSDIPSESDLSIDDNDSLIQQAASLLATCSGVAAAGKVHRRFTFESSLAGRIHVDLTDIPLDNHDYGSVGAQTWGGACVLAEMIAGHPNRFGLCWSPSAGTDDGPCSLRILELGAGTGLVGLTVAKLLHALKDSNPNLPATIELRPQATIVLTDYYPAVLDNLRSNIDANFSTSLDDMIFVNSHLLDWSSFSMTETTPDVLSTPFVCIFGADIVYEARHAAWIHDCLKSLLAYPDESNQDPAFHLVIPLRPTHSFESGMVEEVFGAKDRGLDGSQRELTILSKESIVCEAYGDGRVKRGRIDEIVEYIYYRIGWS